MGGPDVRGAVLALMATTLYYLGFIVFRVAATRMPVLRGTQPIRLIRHTYSNRLWLTGTVIVLAGTATQVKALMMLPLSIAQPIFAASLPFVLFYAAVFFRERLTGREWAGVALFGVATVLIGVSHARLRGLSGGVADPVALAAVVIPGVLIGVVVLVGGDVRAFGRHARPLAGTAYGFGAGVSLGVAELAIKGVAAVAGHDGLRTEYTTPYPYLAIGMGMLGLAQLQIGLQRCRLSIVASVLTVTAKTQLAIVGPLLFKEPWPSDGVLLGLRIGAFALAIVAFALFPRHEAPRELPSVALASAGERA